MGLLQKVASLLFEQPPTLLFVEHGKRVCRASEGLVRAMEAFGEGRELQELKAEVDHWEHEADQVKHEIRRRLPRSDLFLPMARGDLLDLLWQQDEIADKAQDVAHLLSLLPLKLPQALRETWRGMTEGIGETTASYRDLIEGLERHLRGEKRLGDRMRSSLNRIGEAEHRVAGVEGEFIAEIYKESGLDPFSKFHLVEVARNVAQAASHIENAAGRICLLFVG